MIEMRRFALLTVFAFLTVLPASGAELWLRQPALSRDQIAFAYAGDLWVIPRAGGDARRLTTGLGLETDPRFSPDGRWIAFTANYAGNYDVYLVPAEGGMPRRLTWHPGIDRVAGWTPDGERVLFFSGRAGFPRLYTISRQGGLPDEMPLPTALQGSFSPDGERLAYVPHWQRTMNPMNFRAWKRYRGGRTSPVWIARLSDSAVQKVPRENSNDSDPMWIGDRVYFLSDRNGAITLFSYDVASGKVVEALRNDGPDIVSASAGPGGIVYDQFGKLYLFDLASGRSQPVEARVAGDLAAVRPYYAKIADHIESAVLSPTGVRVAFEARDEILTVPAEKGDARNLTRTSGVAERSPAWSPDGQRIAYFSDESGEYALHIADQTGLGKVSKIDLGRPPSFFYYPRWSPDGSKIAFTDKRLNLWYVDVEKGKPVRVDADLYETPFRLLEPVWSPDSRWIAYTKDLRSHLRAVFVYSLATGETRQVTDGMSDARYVAFDHGGKYLYFTASTDAGPTAAWLDLSSVQRSVSRSVYVAVLDKDLPSPLAPQSDEEKSPQETKKGEDGKADDKDKEKDSKPARVKIDFDGIDQRVLALPIPPRNYTALFAGDEGVFFVLESAPLPGFGFEGSVVHRFDLEGRKTEKLA